MYNKGIAQKSTSGKILANLDRQIYISSTSLCPHQAQREHKKNTKKIERKTKVYKKVSKMKFIYKLDAGQLIAQKDNPQKPLSNKIIFQLMKPPLG